MSQAYRITGIEGTGVHQRLELRELQKNPIQFSLFIQGMTKVLNMNNPDPQSKDYLNKPNGWWQIGAIHGLPYTPYSGDPQGPQNPDDNSKWGGYCYHASALFPPWHRVLLLLVEQAVVQEAITIASELKNDKWIQAAKELRFPYWDWTRAETAAEGIPKLCQDTQVEIVTPSGSSVVVDNPLNHYKFAGKPGAAVGAPYMGKWSRTYRWANKDVDPTVEMYGDAQKAFAVGSPLTVGKDHYHLQPLHWLRAKVAALFTFELTVKDPAYGGNMWGYFSNTGAQDDKIDPVMDPMPPSIEEPHNQVHLHCGGNGSMSLNEYAGFDPIFFLHHCNVDRLYAFWEYLYPNYWVANGWKSISTGKINPFLTDSGTFNQDSGTEVSNVTKCHPFRNKAGEYWTSEEVRGLLSTGSDNKYYTYPPIKDPRTGLEIKVDVPYDENNLALRERYRQVLYNEFSPDFRAIIDHHQRFSLPIPLPLHTSIKGLLMRAENNLTHIRQFYLVGELPEFAFPGSYRLELYLLGSDATVVNSISVLGRADPDRCAACVERRAAGNHVRGHMVLDPRLILHLVGQLHHTALAAISALTHLATLVHESFGVRLVRPDGTKLAAADPNLPTHYAVLDASKTPKLTLHSHVIALHDDPAAPIRFHSHEHHGGFAVDATWRAL